MLKKIFVLLTVGILFSINTSVVLAERPVGESCGPSWPADPNEPCPKDFCCKLDEQNADPNFPKTYSCKYDPVCASFGKIEAPNPLKGFLAKDPTGAGAISQFLSNFVALLFSIAAIVLIFMILWGAFEWLTSGGDKEKLSSAQKRIINAFIGIILFAVAFAIIRVVGVFTGFTFFKGQNQTLEQRVREACPNGPPCPISP